MEKEFIPYEQALALKELGFNEDCFGWYNWTGKDLSLTNNSYVDINPTPAPTFSQAFRWFREKYYLHSCISAMNNGIELLYAPLIDIIDKKHKAILDFDVYISYEEAELECLKKLIEIVKEK